MRTRRQFLKTTGGVGAGLCVSSYWPMHTQAAPTPVTIPLIAEEVEVDLAGILVNTWGYNGTVPGREIRIREGETLRVPVQNNIPEPTLVHWHGISLINPMDGTKLVQSPIDPGGNFDYEFVVPEAGTHWYHSHFGTQLDRGMFGPLIVEPRSEELSYDREYTLILDDWSDGLGTTAVNTTSSRTTGARIGGYGSGLWQDQAQFLLDDNRVSFGGRAYPMMLVNARPPADPPVFKVRRGDRVRLRVINAAADTGFRFAIAGHQMTVTHSDGMPVKPVVVDSFRIGMAERYDVIIDANSPGAWQIGVLSEGKNGFGRAILRYVEAAASVTPPADFQPPELNNNLLSYDDLVCTIPPKVPVSSVPDKIFNMILHHTNIDVDGLTKDEPIFVSPGDFVRFNIRNESDDWHPMHLHGHHFHLGNSGRALKDTAAVPSKGGESVWDWHADNPGKWMVHCHNLYHMKDGMIRNIFYK